MEAKLMIWYRFGTFYEKKQLIAMGCFAWENE